MEEINGVVRIKGDHELSGGPARQRPRATEKLPPAAEGGAEGASSPPAPDKVKALFTGAVMTPEVAPKSTLQEEGNLCPQSGLSPPGVNMNTPWWGRALAPPTPPCGAACRPPTPWVVCFFFLSLQSFYRNAVGLLSLDVEMRGLPPLAPPPRVCGEVYLTLPYLTPPQPGAWLAAPRSSFGSVS